LQRLRQKGSRKLSNAYGGPQSRRSQPLAKQPTRRALGRRALHALLDNASANIDQSAKIDTGRAGRFTISAGQAPVKVALRGTGWPLAFEHLLDQINAATWAIEFIAQQLIRGACGEAKPAVHTLAQICLGARPIWRATEFLA
jgi:hypothetical protein